MSFKQKALGALGGALLLVGAVTSPIFAENTDTAPVPVLTGPCTDRDLSTEILSLSGASNSPSGGALFVPFGSLTSQGIQYAVEMALAVDGGCGPTSEWSVSSSISDFVLQDKPFSASFSGKSTFTLQNKAAIESGGIASTDPWILALPYPAYSTLIPVRPGGIGAFYTFQTDPTIIQSSTPSTSPGTWLAFYRVSLQNLPALVPDSEYLAQITVTINGPVPPAP